MNLQCDEVFSLLGLPERDMIVLHKNKWNLNTMSSRLISMQRSTNWPNPSGVKLTSLKHNWQTTTCGNHQSCEGGSQCLRLRIISGIMTANPFGVQPTSRLKPWPPVLASETLLGHKGSFLRHWRSALHWYSDSLTCKPSLLGETGEKWQVYNSLVSIHRKGKDISLTWYHLGSYHAAWPHLSPHLSLSHVLCPSPQAVLQLRHVNIVLCELCMRLLSSWVSKCTGNNPFSSMSDLPVEAGLPSCTSGTPEESPEFPKQGCWTVQGSQCWFTRDTSLSHQRLLAMESSH